MTQAHDAPPHDAEGVDAAGADVDASRETTAHALSLAVLPTESREPKAPAYSVRGTAPGLRGCWAVSKRGDPCGAPRRNDSEYCNAHSGVGITADPKGHSVVGTARAAENRRRRADLRLVLGITKGNTPRGVLKGMAFVEAERIAGRVVGAVLDPLTPPAQAARLGLDLINSVDPPVEATITTSLPTDPEGVSKLSLSQLMELGGSLGLPLPSHSANGSVEPLSD